MKLKASNDDDVCDFFGQLGITRCASTDECSDASGVGPARRV
jgi:hypothetical protein